ASAVAARSAQPPPPGPPLHRASPAACALARRAAAAASGRRGLHRRSARRRLWSEARRDRGRGLRAPPDVRPDLGGGRRGAAYDRAAMRRSAFLLACLTLAVLPAFGHAHPLPSASNCPIFPPDNPWNQRVDSLPVASDSGALIA